MTAVVRRRVLACAGALAVTAAGAVTLVGVQTFADGSTRIWRSARLLVARPGGAAAALRRVRAA